MSDDDVPVIVFEGEYAEVLFLKTLIESAGIETSVYDHNPRATVKFDPPCAIYVRRGDVEHARELVEDFRKNGKRTERWPFGSD